MREVVDHLSKDRKTIVETIKIVEKPYRQWEWYQPYWVWIQGGTYNSNTLLCGNMSVSGQVGAGLKNYTQLTGSGTALNSSVSALSQSMVANQAETSFNGIKTF